MDIHKPYCNFELLGIILKNGKSIEKHNKIFEEILYRAPA